MRTLVVNADDLGADEARNEGIFDAVRAGRVTSVSVLANGPALEHAAERLRALPSGHLSVGAHLNLSEGRPLCRDHSLLVGPDGALRGKAAARELLLRPDERLTREIEREFEAQVQALLARFPALDHLDGHQHVHVFPAALPAVLRLAERHALRWVRAPAEPWPETLPPGLPETFQADVARFIRWGQCARPALAGPRVHAPDHFRGLFLRSRPLPATLAEIVRTLPEGLTELMVHPGRAAAPTAGPFSGFSTWEREKETEALLSPLFGEALERAAVVLSPFPATRA